MAVRLPDFQSLGISNVNPGDIRPTYSGADPVAAAQATLGAGQQKLGTGIETIAGAAAAEYGRQQYAANKLTDALAQASLFERLGDERQMLMHETDPEKVNQIYSRVREHLDAVAQSIPDPTARRLWTAQHLDDVSKVQILARERQRDIFSDRVKAGAQEKIDVLLRQAQQSSDPALHQQANKGVGDIYTYLTEAGVITAAQAQGQAKKAHEALVSGHVHYLLSNNLAPEADAYLDREKNVLDPKVLDPLKRMTKGLADHEVANQFGDAVSQGGGRAGSVSQRNIANNNPGNMKAAGGGWMSFPTPEAGVAAIGDWLERHNASGQQTIRQLIDDPRRGYAPTADPGNAGKNLPEAAARIVGVSPDAPIDMKDPAIRQKMVQAILAQEGNAGFLTQAATGTTPAATAAAGSQYLPSLDEQVTQVENSNLTPEQKEIATTRVLRNDARRRAVMRTEILQVKQLVADDASSTATFGKIVPQVTRERVAAALGEEAADKFVDDRDLGLKFYEQTSDFDHLPPLELHRRLNIMAEAGGGMPGSEKYRKLFHMAEKKAATLEELRIKDPAAAVSQFPAVLAASQGANLNQPETYRPLVDARIQAMSEIETPFDAMVPISRDEASSLYRPIAAASASMDGAQVKRALSRVIQTLQTGWGGYSDVALAAVLRAGHADLGTRELAISTVKKLSQSQTPTPAETRAVDEAAKSSAIGNAVSGLTLAEPAQARTSFPVPHPDAITMLRANPQLKASFDETYGPGAADKIFAIAPPREPAQKPGERGRR